MSMLLLAFSCVLEIWPECAWTRWIKVVREGSLGSSHIFNGWPSGVRNWNWVELVEAAFSIPDQVCQFGD